MEQVDSLPCNKILQ